MVDYMNKVLDDITKEQIGRVIGLFNPYMEDYLYLIDLQNDDYRISEHAVDRFMLPSSHFQDAVKMHEFFVYEDDRQMIMEDLELILSGQKKNHNLHYRWLDRNGQPVWINCCGGVIDDAEGRPHYLVGCINETGRKQRADNISGLLSELEFSACVRSYGNNISSGFFMHIGIDDFNSINGTLGISCGDYIIRKVAECIRGCLSNGQQVYHIVADEYIVADFGKHTCEDAVDLYKDIKESISGFVDSENYKFVFSITAGILDAALYDGSYEKMMKLSEFTLKQARENGKNCYYVFAQEDYERLLRKRKIIRRLQYAVDNDFCGFEAYFQPIVDCETGRLTGAEALMRFDMPGDNGMERVSPFEFIPLLEETGLILPMGRWILNEAVAMCSEMQKTIPDFRINVNISYVQVVKSEVLKDILATLDCYGLAPESIGIELTESGYLDADPHFERFRNGLKSNRIQFIIDDFGTGYSNLHCLSDLSPTYIKIDKTFTDKAMHNAYDHELMMRIIEMAHSLELEICVEGVEQQDVLEEVRKFHADYIQGYLFGKPCPKTEFYKQFV